MRIYPNKINYEPRVGKGTIKTPEPVKPITIVKAEPPKPVVEVEIDHVVKMPPVKEYKVEIKKTLSEEQINSVIQKIRREGVMKKAIQFGIV